MFNIIACFISGDNGEYEESIVSILDEAIASQKSSVLCLLATLSVQCKINTKCAMAQVFIILSPEVAGSVLVTPHPDTGEARPGEGSGRFCKVLSVVSLGQSQSASPASARLPRPPWERRLTPASASPFPSLAKTPEDGNNGGQGGLGWGNRESQDNPTNTHLWS